MNILEAAGKKDEILHWENEVICPECDTEFHSPFDKVYVTVFEKCYTCDKSPFADNNAHNVFEIL